MEWVLFIMENLKKYNVKTLGKAGVFYGPCLSNCSSAMKRHCDNEGNSYERNHLLGALLDSFRNPLSSWHHDRGHGRMQCRQGAGVSCVAATNRIIYMMRATS